MFHFLVFPSKSFISRNSSPNVSKEDYTKSRNDHHNQSGPPFNNSDIPITTFQNEWILQKLKKLSELMAPSLAKLGFSFLRYLKIEIIWEPIYTRVYTINCKEIFMGKFMEN